MTGWPDWQWPARDAHHVPEDGDVTKTYEDLRLTEEQIEEMTRLDVWVIVGRGYLTTVEEPDALPRTAV